MVTPLQNLFHFLHQKKLQSTYNKNDLFNSLVKNLGVVFYLSSFTSLAEDYFKTWMDSYTESRIDYLPVFKLQKPEINWELLQTKYSQKLLQVLQDLNTIPEKLLSQEQEYSPQEIVLLYWKIKTWYQQCALLSNCKSQGSGFDMKNNIMFLNHTALDLSNKIYNTGKLDSMLYYINKVYYINNSTCIVDTLKYFQDPLIQPEVVNALNKGQWTFNYVEIENIIRDYASWLLDFSESFKKIGKILLEQNSINNISLPKCTIKNPN